MCLGNDGGRPWYVNVCVTAGLSFAVGAAARDGGGGGVCDVGDASAA